MDNTWKTGLAPLLLAALLAACGSVEMSETREESFPVGGPPRLVVSGVNGRIELRKGDGDEVRLRAIVEARGFSSEGALEAARAARILTTQSGDEIRIETKSEDDELSVDFELEVPEGATLDLTTTNGFIGVYVSARSLKARSTNGGILAHALLSSVDAQTTNGAIELRGAGDAPVLVKAQSTNGSVHYAGALAAGRSSLRTSNGSVDARPPAEAAFDLDAGTTRGRVTVGFPITLDSGASETRVRGRVGEEPLATLVLETTNGDVTVKPRP